MGSVGVVIYGAAGRPLTGGGRHGRTGDSWKRERIGTRDALKLSLRGVSKPPVWRRLLVPAEMRLDRLHDVIQTAMAHLHVFSTSAGDYGIPDPELGFRNERSARLAQFLKQPGDRIQCAYDFGDGWEHDIVLEARLGPDQGQRFPICLAGKGACPPEDCGGPWGYTDLKEALADPRHEDHQDMLD
jgi:hypothetical protein